VLTLLGRSIREGVRGPLPQGVLDVELEFCSNTQVKSSSEGYFKPQL
jgi:hypothetical protein